VQLVLGVIAAGEQQACCFCQRVVEFAESLVLEEGDP